MGNYLNPGNNGFQAIRKSPYVDKTGLISLINRTIGTAQKLTCISRPRRGTKMEQNSRRSHCPDKGPKLSGSA